MKRKNTIWTQIVFWLAFYGYLLGAFWDRIQPDFFEWVWHPAVLLCLLTFPAVFYGHWKVLMPRVFARKKYEIYVALFLACAFVIVWLKPVDRVMFRGGDRMPPRKFHDFPSGNLSFPPPRTEFKSFLFDPTSLTMFLLLWFLGMGIWLYQNKIKRLITALSNQLESEDVMSSASSTNGAVVESLVIPEQLLESSSEHSMSVHVEYEQVKILFDEIEYIEAFDSYVKIYLSGMEKPVVTRLTLKAIAERLPQAKFVRIHRSFIISNEKAISWTSTKVKLRSGHELPVGRRFKREV